jgi:hypothetical protein
MGIPDGINLFGSTDEIVDPSLLGFREVFGQSHHESVNLVFIDFPTKFATVNFKPCNPGGAISQADIRKMAV